MANTRNKRTPAALPARDLIWQQLEAALGPPAQPIPDGAITAPDYAARYGVTLNRACHALSELAERGVLRRVRCMGQNKRLVYAYLPAEGK